MATMIPVPDDKLKYDSNDVHSAALCAWKEARGDGTEAMCAVVWVLRNRVGFPGFAMNLHDVIYGKNQFTSMSVPSDPEFNLEPKTDDESWVYAQGAALKILNVSTLPSSENDDPTMSDNTNGAHYYANLHTMQKGGWFARNIVLSRNHPITAQIGKQTFFE